MVYVQDNFLPEPLFLWLNEKSLIKSKESYQLAENKSDANFAKFHKTDKTGWDLTYRNLNGSLEIPSQVIGDKVPDIINLLINTIENKTQKPVLPIDNIHFLFTRTGYVVKHHVDRAFKHSSPKKLRSIFKTFIFSHNTWQDAWGGELCFNSGNFLPYPNRLIVYSIDEEHWVNEVKDNNNTIRINFGCRFGDERV